MHFISGYDDIMHWTYVAGTGEECGVEGGWPVVRDTSEGGRVCVRVLLVPVPLQVTVLFVSINTILQILLSWENFSVKHIL